MSYYWFNRKGILQKAKERHSKEKAPEYYLENKGEIKKKSRDWYNSLSKEEKDKIKKRNFLGGKIPKRKHALRLRMEKENYPQVYLEECKYKPKEIQIINIIYTDVESESVSELKYDTELESKSELQSETHRFCS